MDILTSSKNAVFSLLSCFFLCLRTMDGSQDICDVVWLNEDCLGASKEVFFAREDFTPFSPCSSSLTQEGVVEVDPACLAKKNKEEKEPNKNFVVECTTGGEIVAQWCRVRSWRSRVGRVD